MTLNTTNYLQFQSKYLFSICLLTIPMDALAANTNQTELASDLIGNYFTADKYNSFVGWIELLNEIQELKQEKKKINYSNHLDCNIYPLTLVGFV